MQKVDIVFSTLFHSILPKKLAIKYDFRAETNSLLSQMSILQSEINCSSFVKLAAGGSKRLAGGWCSFLSQL